MKKSFKTAILTLVAMMGLTTAGSMTQSLNVQAESVKLSSKNANNTYQAMDETDDASNSDSNYDLITTPYKVKHASAAAAMDETTGKIIYTQNGLTNRKIASLSKLMSLYLVVKKAQATNGWNKIVKTNSSGLRRMGNSASVGGFKFKPGHSYTVRELYKAALIQSSNNATIALGQWVAGSNKKFIAMMNKQAENWDMDASFVSASGLDNNDLKPYGFYVKGGYYAGNKVCAEDLLTIAKNLIDEYPAIVNDSKKSVAYVDGQKLTNENRLLKGNTFYTKSLYVDGLKTGYTPGAGLCLVATSQKPGQHRLLTVVLNDSAEFTDTRDFMKFIYNNASLK